MGKLIRKTKTKKIPRYRKRKPLPPRTNTTIQWIRKPDRLDAIITEWIGDIQFPLQKKQYLLTNVYIKSVGGFE